MGLMKLWGEWFLGMVCYHRNELEAAEQYFTHIFENRFIAQVSPYRDAVAGLALIHQSRGRIMKPNRYLNRSASMIWN